MSYQQQKVLLASKHKKEEAIAPPFLEVLGCQLIVHDFDTDQFGTFTSETPRRLSPYDTCLLKAKTAARQYDYRLAVASEGSFGPHATMPFLPSAHEIMLFVDTQHDWVIAEQMLTLKTNYAAITLSPQTDVSDFLTRIQFPSHALTLETVENKRVIAKGIVDLGSLEEALRRGFQQATTLILATDMRAMHNPTRMQVLNELADKLSRRIARACPTCKTPGFGLKATKGSLPCALCGQPGAFYQQEVWGCVQCDYEECHGREDGLLAFDPSYCSLCNP